MLFIFMIGGWVLSCIWDVLFVLVKSGDLIVCCSERLLKVLRFLWLFIVMWKLLFLLILSILNFFCLICIWIFLFSVCYISLRRISFFLFIMKRLLLLIMILFLLVVLIFVLVVGIVCNILWWMINLLVLSFKRDSLGMLSMFNFFLERIILIFVFVIFFVLMSFMRRCMIVLEFYVCYGMILLCR